jgi:syntaxin-binding protein 1
MTTKNTLLNDVRTSIMNDVFIYILGKYDLVNNVILILDSYTSNAISSIFAMYELMDFKVFLVENIALTRKPFPQYDAIYILSDTEKSINLLIQDTKEQTPLYRTSFVFFIDELSSDMRRKIDTAKVKDIFTEVIELRLPFMIYKSNSFIPYRYHVSGIQNNGKSALAYSKIVYNILKLIHNGEAIEFVYNNNSNNGISKEIVKEINAIANAKQGIRYEDQDAQIDNLLKVIILDRNFDMISPLLTDYTYECVVADLLGIENDSVKIPMDQNAFNTNAGTNNNKKAVIAIGSQNVVWEKYRYYFIGDALKSINQDLHKFIAENPKITKLYNDNNKDEDRDKDEKNSNTINISELALIAKQLPIYKTLLTEFADQITLLGICLQRLNFENMREVALQEYQFAMNVESAVAHEIKLTKEILNVITDPTKFYNKSHQLQWILLFLMQCRDTEERKKVLRSLNEPERTRVSDLLSTYSDVNKHLSNKVSRKHSRDADTDSNLKTYKFELENLVHDIIYKNSVNENYSRQTLELDYKNGSPKLKNTAKEPKFSLRKGTKVIQFKYQLPQSKILVFIVDGMMNSERIVLEKLARITPKCTIISGAPVYMNNDEYIKLYME